MSATRSTSAVVTGAARGFGREIARRLVSRGHRVLITDLDAELVGATADELGATGIVADARVAADHRKVAAAASELGPVGVWVNNAGVLRAGKAWEHPAQVCRRQHAISWEGRRRRSPAAWRWRRRGRRA